jgi:hypothetical protein
MAKNQHVIKRTAYISFTLQNAVASTHESGMHIPAGAIITGITSIAPSAVTLTGASATVVPRVGTDNIAATWNVSSFPAETVIGTTTPIAYVANDGEFNVVEASSVNAAATGTYEMYVDYLYVT